MDCWLCYSEVEPGGPDHHAACHGEWRSRMDTDRCVLCGRGVADRSGGRCIDCVIAGNDRYSGYPGGD